MGLRVGRRCPTELITEQRIYAWQPLEGGRLLKQKLVSSRPGKARCHQERGLTLTLRNGSFSVSSRIVYAQLVKRIAGRMAVRIPSSVLFDELMSAGCVGLINAIDRFDPERDVNLKTYAEYRIKGAILDELRRMDWYSRSMRKKMQDIEKAVLSVESKKGRPAEDTEVAEELGLSLEEYQNTLSAIHGVALLSLDEYIKDEDNDPQD